MTTIAAELAKAKNLLMENAIDTADLDAKLIMLSSVKMTEEQLILNLDKDIDKSQLLDFKNKIRSRLEGKPTSKIVKFRYFWNNKFYVNEDVLDPRPDSEILIEAVVSDYSNEQKLSILDLGTGSGCLILTLLSIFKKSHGLAIDISKNSLKIAQKNANLLNIITVSFRYGNWNDDITEKFDMVVSNPPYIKTSDIEKLQKEVKFFDPIVSLDGGVDGLDCYRYIAKNIRKNLNNNSRIYLEIGKDQDIDVETIFTNNGFKLLKKLKDLNNIYRVMVFVC